MSGSRRAAPTRTRWGSRSAAGRRPCWTRPQARRSPPRTRARTRSCSAERTYDIFAAYWPHQEGEIATLFNSVPKYVASRGTPDLSWAGSTRLGPDLAGAVREIRDRHEHVKVVGSLNLVQTLLREKLFDRLDLWVHPIVLGVGKKVFDGGAVPTNVTLLEPLGG
ncbi:dihydrofolate reductase family protein [Nonomuraea ferruginea]